MKRSNVPIALAAWLLVGLAIACVSFAYSARSWRVEARRSAQELQMVMRKEAMYIAALRDAGWSYDQISKLRLPEDGPTRTPEGRR